ncbi:MAG: elongation factor Ts [Alphaproteobacteria bacterium]|nr:elongation factor Ts [Alphaproteobacteria bacterium]
MAEITAALVKELREKTGAGMMDCKKALSETGGDLEAAIDWLRKKGLSAAAKKASRVASEGLVGVAIEKLTAAIVEVNAETDFVARNEQFQAYVGNVAGVVLTKGSDVATITAAAYPGTGRTVAEELTHLIATIGENMSIRRAARISTPKGLISAYIHTPLAPGLGKIGVIVAIESDGKTEALEKLGRQIGMHIAAARPEALDIASVDPAAVERERSVLAEQARGSGKPEAIIAKMVEGRLRKYYEEVVLLEQVWVHDGESKVAKVLQETAKEAGAPVKIVGFVRFQLGEGIQKQEGDFAAEVAAAAGVR